MEFSDKNATSSVGCERWTFLALISGSLATSSGFTAERDDRADLRASRGRLKSLTVLFL